MREAITELTILAALLLLLCALLLLWPSDLYITQLQIDGRISRLYDHARRAPVLRQALCDIRDGNIANILVSPASLVCVRVRVGVVVVGLVCAEGSLALSVASRRPLYPACLSLWWWPCC